MKKVNLVLLSFSVLTILSSCNSYTFSNIEYPEGGIVDYLLDEDMVLDGKADEQVYNDLEIFEIYEPENKLTLKTKVYEGKNGWYFYQEVDDTSVMFSKNKQVYQNDGVELHINVDPDSCIELSSLKRANKITTSMLQIRISVGEQLQTWVGNNLSGSYEWTMYYKPCQSKVFVDGEINKENGAKGYGVETFVPYKAFDLESAPSKISIMPAFNNSSSNLDTSRKWFTKKGMSHNNPSSWIHYSQSKGFIYNGKDVTPNKEIKADGNDEKYSSQKGATLFEVNQNNKDQDTRAIFKSFYDDKGVYIYSKVYDKVYSRNNDSIWSNDGIEFMIDTNYDPSSDLVNKDGMFRFGLDVDNGLESDMYVVGHYNPVPYFMNTYSKVSVEKIETCGLYGYEYQYVYEAFIPFESMNLTKDDISVINVNFAVKSPFETAYIKDRKDGNGNMEGQDWLWIDRHYPLNSHEYFTISENGLI